MIGISERGFGTLRVHAIGQPGHSSMPPPETAVSLVSEAVVRIHDMPIEQRLEGGPAIDMMRALAPERLRSPTVWPFRMNGFSVRCCASAWRKTAPPVR